MSDITLGRYLFERLKQVQIKTIFGLPGDFNLSLLDKIYEVEGLRWAGNANELNASYAADGYSRVKGISAIITTFGVGELSALNGIAGSYAEHVGVIHIVGVPSISSQAKQLLLHHTLGNGDFTVFHRMSSNISHTTAFIKDINSAPAEIDRVIRDAYVFQRPVYLALPANLVDDFVSSDLLSTPIDLSLKPNDVESEDEVIETVLDLIKKSENPVILVDACASRHNVKKETIQLMDITQFPTFVTPMGKGVVDEHHPRFGGTYVGSLSSPEVKDVVENSDLILSVGSLLSDFNTGSFSYSYKTKNIVEFHSDFIKIRNATFPGLHFKLLLQKLIPQLSDSVQHYVPKPVPSLKVKNLPVAKNTSLNQEWLWTEVSSWLQEGDVVLTETGTSAFGIIQSVFPPNTTGISQVLWGSIGYSVGATLGAVAASEEIDPSKRVILFVGDGSLQLTVQEISTMIRWGLKPYIFVLNNDGYTIERLIHGEKASYNDIQSWDHQALLKTFGANDTNSESIRVSTTGEFENLVSDPEFAKNDKIRLIEIMLPVMDAPENLVKQAQLTAAVNAKE